MASTAQSGATQSQQQSSSSNEAPLSWEGDRMFNIYIYDYCYKRGFKKTANELLQEANIPPDSKPPINARQGLLFEWWSVFWVLFSAKANGNGSEDAMVYTQHQASQAVQRQLQQQRMQPPSQAPIPGGPMGQPGGPQPPPSQRIMNGPMGPRLGPPFPMNGPMPNGVASGQLPPGQIPPGPGPFPNMAGPGPHPNGMPGSGPPQSLGASPVQPQNFQTLLPNQRPLGAPGGPQQSPQPPQPMQQQQRPNGGPFQRSPTMANSPGQGQQQTTLQQQPQQPPQPHGQPPMGQLGGMGPSPHMQHLNRGMHPPQGQNPLNPGVHPGNTPNSAFVQLAGRPPSRATTPGSQSNMMQPSPSLLSRQPPVTMQPQDYLELQQLPPHILHVLKQECGYGDRDIAQLTPPERNRMIQVYRMRRSQQKPEGSGPAGLQPPNPQMRGMPTQPQPRLKRSSTTPEEQHDGPRNDSSPPQKRPRPSPEQHAIGIFSPSQPGQPQGGPQPGQPGMPMAGQNPMMMMQRPGQMGGPMAGGGPQPGQPPRGTPMNMNLSQPPLGGPQLGGVAMNPQHPAGHPGQSGLMNSQLQQQQQQYRQQIQNMQALKGPIPPQVMNPTVQGPGNNGAPTQSEPGLHPGAPGGLGGPQFNRLQPQNKAMSMMMPPSPANKDQASSNKDVKQEDGIRNAPGNAGGTAPSTPAPGVPGSNGPGPQGPPPPATNGAPNTNIAPSPSSSSILGPPLNPSAMVNPPTVMTETLFPPDFMQHLTNSLDDFDSNIFRNDGDINFERDFGQWFNGDDVTPLDMK